jgi:hypothetical protein
MHGHEHLVGHVAELLRDRNAIDADLARIIGRPVTAGHLGEWIASVVFDIELESSASAKGIDGRFRSGPLQGNTVNIKWYMKHQGLLDTTEHAALDCYLVLAGPPSPAGSSRARPSRGASAPYTSSMPASCARSRQPAASSGAPRRASRGSNGSPPGSTRRPPPLPCRLRRIKRTCSGSSSRRDRRPDDLSRAVPGGDQHDGLGGHLPGRVGARRRQPAAHGFGWLRTGRRVQRPAEQVDAAASERGRVAGIAAELRRAVVGRPAPPVRERPVAAS